MFSILKAFYLHWFCLHILLRKRHLHPLPTHNAHRHSLQSYQPLIASKSVCIVFDMILSKHTLISFLSSSPQPWPGEACVWMCQVRNRLCMQSSLSLIMPLSWFKHPEMWRRRRFSTISKPSAVWAQAMTFLVEPSSFCETQVHFPPCFSSIFSTILHLALFFLSSTHHFCHFVMYAWGMH